MCQRKQLKTEIIPINPTGISQQPEAAWDMPVKLKLFHMLYSLLKWMKMVRISGKDNRRETDHLTGENTSGEGNGKATDYLTSVLTFTTQDVANRKEKLQLGKLLARVGATMR